MSAKKSEILKDLKFCQELMNRLVKSAEKMGNTKYLCGHTKVQSDIIRLRRELNEVREKMDWNYSEEDDDAGKV